MAATDNTLSLFYCYARKDQHLRDELDAHLTALRRSGRITTWYDGELVPGELWEQAIEQQLKKADIILLLISPDFMRSEYCYGKEMMYAIARHQAKSARVVPILLRPVDWEGAPFASIQMLPSNTRAVTSSGWSNHDEAFEDVARGLRHTISELRDQRNDIVPPIVPEQHSPSNNKSIHSSADLTSAPDIIDLARRPGQTKELPKVVARVNDRFIHLDTYNIFFEVKKTYTHMKIQQFQLEIQKMMQSPNLTNRRDVAMLQRTINEDLKDLNNVTRFRQLTLQELIYNMLIQDEINLAIKNIINTERYLQFNSRILVQTDSAYEELQKFSSWDSHFPLNFTNPSDISQIKRALQSISRLELFNKEFAKDPSGIIERIREQFKTAEIDYTLINVSIPIRNFLMR